jgi:hypothetical protein
MTTETITDYETKEVTREVIHCDARGCPAIDDNEDVVTVKLSGRDNRHYCSTHAKELLGVEGEMINIRGDTTPVIEQKALITMPWDVIEDDNEGGRILLPVVVLITVFPLFYPWFTYGALNNDNENVDMGVWVIISAISVGMMIWSTIPFVWFVIL